MDLSAMILYMSVSAITPGPNNLMSLYLGANVGFKTFRAYFLGSTTGLFVKALLCGLLNLLLSGLVPKAVPVLKWFGAAYMVYLAYTMIRSGMKDGPLGASGGESTFMSGILLQCLNVKSWITALSIFSVYVTPYTQSPAVITLTAAAYAAVIGLSSLAWYFFGHAIREVYRRYRLPISVVMSLSLLFCAYTAIR